MQCDLMQREGSSCRSPTVNESYDVVISFAQLSSSKSGDIATDLRATYLRIVYAILG